MATILLVEDDNNLREIYEARLKAEGYDIASANDGEEALVVAKEKKPDLIIADIMMPKISGFEMLDILRNTAGLQDVKIIMLTALGQAEDQQKATSLGADRYLVKSQVTLEDIVNAAHDLLENPKAATPAATQTTTPQANSTPPAQPTANPQPQAMPITPEPAQNATVPSLAQTAKADDKLLDDTVNSFGGKDSSTDPLKPAATLAPTAPTIAATSTPTATTPLTSNTTTMPTMDTGAPAAIPTPSTLEISNDLASQLKEESKEVESATTEQAMDKENNAVPLPVVPPANQGADSTTVASDQDAESTTSPMKVIKPLPSEEKKDINALLQQEAMKEDMASGAAVVSNQPETSDPDKVQVIAPSQPSDQRFSGSTDIAL